MGPGRTWGAWKRCFRRVEGDKISEVQKGRHNSLMLVVGIFKSGRKNEAVSKVHGEALKSGEPLALQVYNAQPTCSLSHDHHALTQNPTMQNFPQDCGSRWNTSTHSRCLKDLKQEWYRGKAQQPVWSGQDEVFSTEKARVFALSGDSISDSAASPPINLFSFSTLSFERIRIRPKHTSKEATLDS